MTKQINYVVLFIYIAAGSCWYGGKTRYLWETLVSNGNCTQSKPCRELITYLLKFSD